MVEVVEREMQIPRKKPQGIRAWIRASLHGAGLAFCLHGRQAPPFPGLRRLAAVEGGGPARDVGLSLHRSVTSHQLYNFPELGNRPH